MNTLPQLSAALVLGATLLAASPATAHIALLDPPARYNGAVGNQNKACPCGVGQSNRLCDVEGDRSDDFRSPRVTTLEPGSTLTVQWEEYVGHTGRYRIAFDPDGADLDDFNANVLVDIVDPPGADGNSGDGSIWEVDVTVPDTPCDNCTLQLIQMMDGDTTAPVLDPVGRSTYYQCADIIIAGPVADVGTATPDMNMGTPDLGSGPGPSDMGSTTPGADTGQSSSGADGGLSNVDGSGGCAVGGSTRSFPFAFLGVVLALGRRRRRRSSRD